jgi:tripartite-type tricarboxylate transporter receptor subunit TctC
VSARVLARVGICATLTFLGAIGAAQLWTAHAQSGYPNRPVTLVVPYPAGGTADLLCRFAADKVSSNLGGQVVVENRPGGAGGRIGTEAVLRAPPDGYTLLCAAQLTFSVTHLLFSKASFDPRALEPVSVLATYPLILVAPRIFPSIACRTSLPLRRSIPERSTTAIKARARPGIFSASC